MASTAQQLIAYHRELVGGGLDHETIQALVKDAAQTIVMNDGLVVTLQSTPPPGVPSKPLPPQA
ncbi:hypothetical protein ACIOJG_20360 [Streptomyces anulatus]